jgi:hypothetical protein
MMKMYKWSELSTLGNVLDSIGISIIDRDHRVKTLREILDELVPKWEILTEECKNTVSKAFAGLMK